MPATTRETQNVAPRRPFADKETRYDAGRTDSSASFGLGSEVGVGLGGNEAVTESGKVIAKCAKLS